MSLANYTAKRLLLIIPVLFGVSIVVFLLLKLAPGNTVSALIPPAAQSPAKVAQVTEKYGLNKPLHIQYLRWVGNALQGDFGRSYQMGRPVSAAVGSAAWATLQLSFVAVVLSLVIAVPLGIVSAVYKDTWIDHVGRLVAFGGISLPAFWVGILLILVLSLFWKQWFGATLIPPGGYAPISEGPVTWFRYVITPGATLAVGFSAIITRQIRSAMIDVLNEDYIRTARSKGAKETVVVLIHAFRNGLIPVVTVLGFQIGFLMNGAVVVEQVFQWPGIGRLLFQAVSSRDMPLVQGIILFIAVVFVSANLVVDVLYAFLDPRIEY